MIAIEKPHSHQDILMHVAVYKEDINIQCSESKDKEGERGKEVNFEGVK